jgi:hypothetical protein
MVGTRFWAARLADRDLVAGPDFDAFILDFVGAGVALRCLD